MNPMILAFTAARVFGRQLCTLTPKETPKNDIGSHNNTKVTNHINPNCGLNEAYMKARFSSPLPNTGVAKVDFFPNAEHFQKYQNSANCLHGGTLFTLHDLAACHALTEAGLQGATKSASVSYIAPVEAKYVCQAQAVATIKAIRGHSAHVQSDLFINDETLVSTAQMVFSVWKPNNKHE